MLAFGAWCLIGNCIVLLLLYEMFLLCLLLVEAKPSREISEASMVDSTVIEGRCDPRLKEGSPDQALSYLRCLSGHHL